MLGPWVPAFAGTSGEHRPCRSLRLDVGGADHPGPFLGFIADELAEISRRARQSTAAEVGESRLDLGIGKRGVDLAVEFLDDRRGVSLGAPMP